MKSDVTVVILYYYTCNCKSIGLQCLMYIDLIGRSTTSTPILRKHCACGFKHFL